MTSKLNISKLKKIEEKIWKQPTNQRRQEMNMKTICQNGPKNDHKRQKHLRRNKITQSLLALLAIGGLLYSPLVSAEENLEKIRELYEVYKSQEFSVDITEPTFLSGPCYQDRKSHFMPVRIDILLYPKEGDIFLFGSLPMWSTTEHPYQNMDQVMKKYFDVKKLVGQSFLEERKRKGYKKGKGYKTGEGTMEWDFSSQSYSNGVSSTFYIRYHMTLEGDKGVVINSMNGTFSYCDITLYDLEWSNDP